MSDKGRHPTPTSERDYTVQLGSRLVSSENAALLREAMERHGIGHDHPILAALADFLFLRDDIVALLETLSRKIDAPTPDERLVAATESLQRSYARLATFVFAMSAFLIVCAIKPAWDLLTSFLR